MAQVTLIPSADVYIKESTPTANLEADTLWLGERNDQVGSTQRILIKWDLSSIPSGSTIDSASLKLYIIVDRSNNARTARLRYLKRDWVEDEATWNVYSTGNSWGTAGAANTSDIDSTDNGTASYTASETTDAYKTYTIDSNGVTTIQNWLDGSLSNYGWRIAMDTELDDAYRHESRTHVNGNDPQLVVDYTPGGGFFYMST